MATIEGNEIALRNVFDELTPRSRDNSTAKLNNDQAVPFFTGTYELTNLYGQSLAPSWVYGLTFEGPSNVAAISGSVPPNASANSWLPIYVSWGTVSGAPGQSEAVLYPGQTIEFPRGARRVFVRSSIAPGTGTATVVLTWKTDLWAHKTDSAGNQSQVQLATGSGLVSGTRSFGPGGSPLVFSAAPRSSLIVGFRNDMTIPIQFELHSGGFYDLQLDTAAIPAGAIRIFHYGPGIGSNLPAGQQGHNFAFPESVDVYVRPNAPPVPGETFDLQWWAR